MSYLDKLRKSESFFLDFHSNESHHSILMEQLSLPVYAPQAIETQPNEI